MRLRETTLSGGGLLYLLLMAACGSSGPGSSDGACELPTDCPTGETCSEGTCIPLDSGTGGGASTGGANHGVGGAPTGGADASGGPQSTGGVVATGGTQSTGGSIATGGTSSGGSHATGGVPTTTGGMTSTGGTLNTGGVPSTGGSTTSGGAPATGGTNTGGASDTGTAGVEVSGGAAGTVATGGAPSSGGSAETGGTTGSDNTGGTGSGTIITTEGRNMGDGECHPLCVDAASDPDGDGWGWEQQASCVVVGSSPYDSGSSCTIEQTLIRPVGGGECQAPVNPNASTKARNLLCYLYEIYGNHVLSGQQETSWAGDPAADVEWVHDTTGEYPAILGGDYLYPSGTTDRAIAWANAGGITMIRYHMGAPPLEDTYENSQQAVANGISSVLTAGTPEYASFLQKLDYAATELQRLEDADVPVLWAPFHEASGDWFWWGMEDGAYVAQLWNFTYDYLTNTKGLDNLIWLFPFAGAINDVVYPGKATVDLAGPDTYDANQPFPSHFNNAVELLGPSLPVPLHETGLVVDPNVMFNEQTAPWVLFNVWATYQNDGQHNTVEGIQTAYSSSFTINRDDLPSFD